MKIAIVGAGLSGLVVANRLNQMADVTVFEKSRGLGGRICTRYAEPFYFDHGAQFFTVKTDAFQSFISPMLNDGVIVRWDGRFTELTPNQPFSLRQWDSSFPHYVGTPHNDAIGRYLGRHLNVSLTTQVSLVLRVGEQWQLFDTTQHSLGIFDWVIFAIPAEQVRSLVPLEASFFTDLVSVNMQACYSMMLGFDHLPNIPFDAALVHESDISWISANHQKPGRKTPPCLLIHSSNDWADAHFEWPKEEVMSHLSTTFENLTGINETSAVFKSLHRWRYANISKQQRPPFLIDVLNHLACCGDWCIHGRIEAAFTSGTLLAEHLINEQL